MNNELNLFLYCSLKKIEKDSKDILKKYNLNFTQYIVLNYLFKNNSVISREICDNLHIEKGSLSPILMKFENEGLIEKTRPVKDERTLIVSLTKKGISFKQKMKKIDEELNSIINLKVKDKEKLISFLTLLYEE